MTDIVIGQCDLHIRRPAGTAAPWLDGDDHKAVARRVQAVVLPMLDEWLAPHLQDGPLAAHAPLRIDLNLVARDLAGAAPLARPGLRSRLAAAVAAAVSAAQREARTVDAGHVEAVAEATPTPEPAPQRQSAPDDRAAVLRLLELLTGPDGEADALALLSPGALRELLIRVLDALPARLRAAIRDAETREAPTDGHLSAATDHEFAGAAVKALRLLASALSGARADSNQPTAPPRHVTAALQAAQRVLLRREAHLPETGATKASPAYTPPTAARESAAVWLKSPTVPDPSRPPETVADQDSPTPLAAARAGRYFLDHALPVLALAMLARHGILDAFALDAAAPGLSQSLAAAVAFKTLPPETDRGPGAWSDEAKNSAALATGLATAPSGRDFSHLAGRMDGSPLRATLAATLLGSLHPRGPLALVCAQERAVLFDPGGLYPVAAGAAETLARLLRDIGRPVFVAPPDPAVWAQLEAAGLAAIAAGPALGGQTAKPVAGPGGWRGHATDAVRLSPGLRARLPDDADVAARARKVWQALTTGAALLAGTPDACVRQLDEIAALLAGFALADIGWTLAQRNPASWAAPDPLLVRDRFADLSGWIEITPNRIFVALPMGRRFTDLRDAHLLDTCAAPPWWPGRDISFRGG